MNLRQFLAHFLQITLKHFRNHIDVLLPLYNDLLQLVLNLVRKSKFPLLTRLVAQFGLGFEIVDRCCMLLHSLSRFALVLLKLLRERDNSLHQLPVFVLTLLVETLAYFRAQIRKFLCYFCLGLLKDCVYKPVFLCDSLADTLESFLDFAAQIVELFTINLS